MTQIPHIEESKYMTCELLGSEKQCGCETTLEIEKLRKQALRGQGCKKTWITPEQLLMLCNMALPASVEDGL